MPTNDEFHGLDEFLFWHGLYLRAKEINEYSDLDLKVENLKTKATVTHNFTDDDELVFYGIVKENYQRNNRILTNYLKNRIDRRMTRGQTFAEDLIKVDDLISRNETDNQDIEKYIEIFDEISKTGDIIIEKIYVEKFNIGIAGLGILLGFLLGIIGGYLLHFAGIC